MLVSWLNTSDEVSRSRADSLNTNVVFDTHHACDVARDPSGHCL